MRASVIARIRALAFLREVCDRAEEHAEALDPKRLRRYDKDAVLKALDGLAMKAKNALATSDAQATARKR